MISAARPKIANYHFTTLTPVLGVVHVGEEQSFVCADIPGLIEARPRESALGTDFLRHVERCRLLLHVVDVSGCEGRDPRRTLNRSTTNSPVSAPSSRSARRSCLATSATSRRREQVEEFRAFIEGQGLTFLTISAATRQGIEKLPALVYSRLQQLPPG